MFVPLDMVPLFLAMASGIILIIFTWGLAKFDYAYCQQTMGNGPKRRRFQNWSRVVDVLFLLLCIVFFLLSNFVSVVLGKYTVGSLSVFGKFAFFSFIFLCLSLVGFLVWPVFRSHIMLKLGLDVERYIHRAVVCVMFLLLIKTVFDWAFTEYNSDFISIMDRLLQPSDYPRIDLLFGLLVHTTLVLLLVLEWGSKRNGRKVWVRLGINKKSTWKGFFIVSLFLLIFMGIGLLIGYIMKKIGELWDVQWMQYRDLPRLDWFTILLAGVAPGISEEFAFRGALQPRVGIWVSSFVFTLFQLQYGSFIVFSYGISPYDWFGILFIFLLSLFLGWVAYRYSLWLSVWAHMLMNIILGILPWVLM